MSRSIVAGVDIGSSTSKAVILEDRRVLSYSIIATGAESAASSKRAMAQALALSPGLSLADLDYIVATGYGRVIVPFAQRQSAEVLCQGRGAFWLFPQGRTVLNLGAESNRAIRLGPGAKVMAFVTNDKCAAGSGLFLEAMARVMEVPQERMGELALAAGGVEEVSNICAVFAESEIISHIHRGVPKEHILAGLHKAIAGRVWELASRVGIEREVVVTGGMAKNRAIVFELGKRLGFPLLVPEEPQMVGALGAALLAQETFGRPEALPKG